MSDAYYADTERRNGDTMNTFDISTLPTSSHIHFIGIGGISMSGLAQIMLKNGYSVSGSDSTKSKITEKLEALGAKITYGHSEENIIGADVIVYTAAVHSDNPEFAAAKKSGAVMLSRAEFLGAIMRLYKNALGVSGTHGKTTTTGMLAYALIAAHFDPTVSIGGELDIIGGNIKTGASDYFITEACEYTNSFLEFFPTVSVITNIDNDHLDFFSGIDEIIDSFRRFAMLTEGKGFVVACGSDENVKKALLNTPLDIKYYGIGNGYEYSAKNITYESGYPVFDVWHNDDHLMKLHLRVPGEHNILNALAVIAVCDNWGADLDLAKSGIESFRGAARRFDKKGELNGAIVIDDYAHHPTEIQATLKACTPFVKNKLWCVFQPHTYSRTKTLWREFCESFDNVDELIITHIYAAREKSDGVTRPENLAEDIKKRGVNARFIESFEEIEELLKRELKDGDTLITMGAGDVVNIADDILK